MPKRPVDRAFSLSPGTPIRECASAPPSTSFYSKIPCPNSRENPHKPENSSGPFGRPPASLSFTPTDRNLGWMSQNRTQYAPFDARRTGKRTIRAKVQLNSPLEFVPRGAGKQAGYGVSGAAAVGRQASRASWIRIIVMASRDCSSSSNSPSRMAAARAKLLTQA